MDCTDCKYYHFEDGVCCNKNSKHFTSKPWEYGYPGCSKGEARQIEPKALTGIKTLEDLGFKRQRGYYDNMKGVAIDISLSECRKYGYLGNRSTDLAFTAEEIMAIAEVLKSINDTDKER